MSTNSSDGVDMKTTLPSRASLTSGTLRARAAPMVAVSWAWWPQQWAAPVSGLVSLWLAMGRASSSPMTATVGPAVPLGFK